MTSASCSSSRLSCWRCRIPPSFDLACLPRATLPPLCIARFPPSFLPHPRPRCGGVACLTQTLFDDPPCFPVALPLWCGPLAGWRRWRLRGLHRGLSIAVPCVVAALWSTAQSWPPVSAALPCPCPTSSPTAPWWFEASPHARVAVVFLESNGTSRIWGGMLLSGDVGPLQHLANVYSCSLGMQRRSACRGHCSARAVHDKGKMFFRALLSEVPVT